MGWQTRREIHRQRLWELEGEGAEAAVIPAAQAPQLPQLAFQALQDALRKAVDGLDVNVCKIGDVFMSLKMVALDGNKKRNSQQIVGGRPLLLSRATSRTHIIYSMRAFQSIEFVSECHHQEGNK